MSQDWEEAWKREGASLPWIVDSVQPSLIKYAELLKPKKVLEIGCGDGLNAIWLQNNGCDVTAIDLSESAIRFAKNKHPDLKNIFAQDILTFNTKEKYDFIFDRGCLHGFQKLEMMRFVDKVYDLLTFDGYWLNISGKPCRLYTGPPQASLAMLSSVMERKLEIVSANTVELLSKPNDRFPAWELLCKKV